MFMERVAKQHPSLFKAAVLGNASNRYGVGRGGTECTGLGVLVGVPPAVEALFGGLGRWGSLRWKTYVLMPHWHGLNGRVNVHSWGSRLLH